MCRTALRRALRGFLLRNRGRDWVTLHSLRKSRPIRHFGNLLFLGLAVCVFTWGLQYKLSLYDPPQAASHQIPHAKLLSKNEQSGTTESQLEAGTRTLSRVIYAVPAAAFMLLLLVLCAPDLQATGQREERARDSWHLRRALLNILAVRPPPIFA